MCKSFGVDSLLWMRPGSTTTYLRRNNSENSGERIAKVCPKCEVRFIGRKGDGNCFLGCSWNHPYCKFAEGSNNHREILCNTSKPFARKTTNGTSEIGAQKNPFSSRQRSGSHFHSFNGKSAWIRVQIFALFILLYFGSFWHLFISKFVDAYLKGIESSYFSERMKKLEERWTKCVEVEGDYVEK